MGTESVEFGLDELRLVGGDYGQVIIEGATEEARRALDEVVASVRRSGERHVVLYLQLEYDSSPDLFEERHAGTEGTTRIESGAEQRSENAQGAAARGANHRPDASDL